MKKFTLLLLPLFLCLSGVIAQDDNFEKDILKMLSLNGSSESYDMIFDQLVLQMKAGMPEVPSGAWAQVKADVFDTEVQKLEQQLIPIYKEHFTHDEIKAIIAFYETEAGKALAKKTPLITQESMVIGQQWGMSLGVAIQDFLRNNGYLNK